MADDSWSIRANMTQGWRAVDGHMNDGMEVLFVVTDPDRAGERIGRSAEAAGGSPQFNI